MIRKLVSSCLAIISCGVSARSYCLRSLKSETLPDRKSSLPCSAVRPDEIIARRSRRARAQPGSFDQASISCGVVAR